MIISNINNYLNQISDSFAENQILPRLDSSYKQIGNRIARISGPVIPSFKTWIEKKWLDPFSTQFVYKITHKVEILCRKIAIRCPSKQTGIAYLDRCMISCAQNLYIYCKEVNYLLALPEKITGFTRALSLDVFSLQLKHSIGKQRIWAVVNIGVLFFKKIALRILNIFVKAMDALVQLFSLGQEVKVFSFLAEVITATIDKVHLKFDDVAHNSIRKIETRLRKQVTAAIACHVSKYIVKNLSQLFLKSIIGGSVYFSAKYFVDSFLPTPSFITHSIGIATIGSLLWINVFKPNLDPYYEEFDSHFDPDSSRLKQFCKKFDILSFYFPLRAAHQIFKGY